MSTIRSTRTTGTRRTARASVATLAVTAVVAVVAGLLVAGGPGPAAGADPGGPADATHVVRLSPVTATGVMKPNWRVTLHRGRGHCFAGSEAVGDGAYRCFSGNLVLDPCWAERGAGSRPHVLCAASPWLRSAARVRLRHLPATTGRPHNLWGLQLANGRKCTFVQGASGTFHHKRIGWDCAGGLYLYGEPDRTTARWTIGAVTMRHRHWTHAHRVRIARAVLGRPSP